MTIKWVCKTCGAVHDGNTAMKIVLSGFFAPIEVKEQPRELPKPVQKSTLVKPQTKPAEYADDEEEMEDLRVD